MSSDHRAFLGEGTFFEGKLSFSETVRIDGHLRGDVNASGTLEVGETGVIEARCEVGTLIVRGVVNGEVAAKERVEVLPGGRLEGRVTTPRIRVDDGGHLTATVSMGESSPVPPPT